MRNFFTALNFTGQSISLAQSAGNPLLPLVPSDDNGGWANLLLVYKIIIILGCGVILACMVNLCYLCCCKSRKKTATSLSLNDTKVEDTFISKDLAHNTEEMPKFADVEEADLTF